MHYVIFENERRDVLLRSLEQEEEDYMRDVVIPALRPLSIDEYLNGPAVIAHTLARWSYVLDEGDLFWCVEWDPGLLVVRFSSDGGRLSWCAIRSLNPEFGGRVASEEELDAFDEDAHDSQYELVFTAWDAQHAWHPVHDPDARDGFAAASPPDHLRCGRAFAQLDVLGSELKTRFGNDMGAWFERCKLSPIWRGQNG